MKGGYVKIYRRLFDHEVFDSFDEAAMFVDFIARAAWADVSVSYKGHYLALSRGQFSMSLRDMAERYGTSVGSVRRRLVKWAKHGLIEHANGGGAGTGVNIITVCNYDKYQFAEQKSEESDNAPVGILSPVTQGKRSRAPSGTDVRFQGGRSQGGAPSSVEKKQMPGRRQASARARDRSDQMPAAHLCPEDFTPNDANKAYAKACGFSRTDFDTMVADMKDWSRAAPGQKGQRNDWQAMFRRWMRREVQARAPNVVSLHGSQATGRQI